MSVRAHLQAEDGSVLVETLISAAIVATILAAGFRIGADSVARHGKVEARRYALMVARSRLAEVGSAIPYAAGETAGTDSGDTWKVDQRPCGGGSVGRLYCVSVAVREADNDTPLVVLNSRRLAPAA